MNLDYTEVVYRLDTLMDATEEPKKDLPHVTYRIEPEVDPEVAEDN